MKARAEIAPPNTVRRGCLIAMMAAIKKVLSPSSETTIIEREAIKACMNPRFGTDVWVVDPTMDGACVDIDDDDSPEDH